MGGVDGWSGWMQRDRIERDGGWQCDAVRYDAAGASRVALAR